MPPGSKNWTLPRLADQFPPPERLCSTHLPPHTPAPAQPLLRTHPPSARTPRTQAAQSPALSPAQGRLRGYRGKRGRRQRTRLQRWCRLRRTRKRSWRTRMMMRRARSPVSMELPPRPVARSPRGSGSVFPALLFRVRATAASPRQ